ncbi:imidazole glycerol phosphate synthase subunit HisH [Akkermansiaceae bacterium]|nr:imidazole glycerol phosphate synthase subunit HisH [Akkermansiaceae bacterium]MDC0291155.1 imidazole glycerol phosphate synthase subunit HisH [Akkermansiaceae bacterium]
MKKIAIIDFKVGNIFSVVQACKKIGLDVEITSDYDVIMNSDGVILPGVGAFGDAMKNLKDQNLVETIRDFIDSGKPFMGICLGLQLLFSSSEEFGRNEGLNIIEGSVERFDESYEKVPQIGWNKISKKNASLGESPLDSIEDNEYMYFVHSYFVKPVDESIILTMTDYSGQQYCSSIQLGNIFATQFHPEKSGHKGLEIYKNWSNQL